MTTYLDELMKKRREAPPGKTTIEVGGRLSADDIDQIRTANDTELVPLDITLIDHLRSESYLVKGLIPRPGLTLVHAEPGVGKSFMALDLALCLATDQPTWCGHRLAPGVKTMYVYSEGVSRLWKRRDAWLQRHGIKLDALAGRVEVLPRSLPLNAMGKRAEAMYRDFTEHMKSQKFGLIIIDTWATANVGSNENDSGEMSKGLERLRRITETANCSVLVVHHDKKGGGEYRGSTAIDGALDARLHLKREGPRPERGLKLISVKQRDDTDVDQWHARLEQVQLGLDDEGDPITSVVFTHVEEAEAVKRVYDLAQVSKAIWQFLQDTLSDSDEEAWSKSDVVRKPHSSLIGTQRERKMVIERMAENGIVLERQAVKTDASGRSRRYQRLVPMVERGGAFSELLATLQGVES